ncbi:hypothetical protein [Corallococcus silvisoli]|uniref:hypothetical protein n=1 Tax=Corallococcus silvisoli TaxID=2697031 RepID=UPI001378933E|nr:hypothetical protein [Corallococcus silvisoli]NBD09451.1 hypothetical protein [Corallococcus silvisoli]
MTIPGQEHRGGLHGEDVRHGEAHFAGGRVRLSLRVDAHTRAILAAAWEAPASVDAGHPLAACLESLCQNAVGIGVDQFLRFDDFHLRAGCPEGLEATEEAGLAVRVFRSAFSQFHPRATGPAYLSSGLVLAKLPHGTRADWEEPGFYFAHYYREELWSAAVEEARQGGVLGPRAACAYIDALLAKADDTVELDWPVQEGAATWDWLTRVCLPSVAGGAERARRLLEGGYGGASGTGSFPFGHLDGGPWHPPEGLPEPRGVGHAEFIIGDLEHLLPELPRGGILLAAPRWMAVGQTPDSPTVRRAGITAAEAGGFGLFNAAAHEMDEADD